MRPNIYGWLKTFDIRGKRGSRLLLVKPWLDKTPTQGVTFPQGFLVRTYFSSKWVKRNRRWDLETRVRRLMSYYRALGNIEATRHCFDWKIDQKSLDTLCRQKRKGNYTKYLTRQHGVNRRNLQQTSRLRLKMKCPNIVSSTSLACKCLRSVHTPVHKQQVV